MQTGYSGGSVCRTFENGAWEQRSDRSWRDPGFAQTGQHPAVCIGWHDAQAYVKWLSEETGKQYRLLSEVGVGVRGTGWDQPLDWYWGNDVTAQCRHANGADQTLRTHVPKWVGKTVRCDDRHARTAPVGSFAKNGYGLYDVIG